MKSSITRIIFKFLTTILIIENTKTTFFVKSYTFSSNQDDSSMPCPPPGLEDAIENEEECLCFYSLIATGINPGNPSTYANVFGDDSVQHFAQSGTYVGFDGIAEYFSFVGSGEFVSNFTEVGMSLILNMEFSANTGRCIATVATRSRYPFNPKYVKDNQDLCVDVINGSVLKYALTGDVTNPVNIETLNSWSVDGIISEILPLLDTPATAEYVCDVITGACGYDSIMRGARKKSAQQMCLEKYNKLPVFNTLSTEEESLSYVDGNSKGCRILHSFYASTNDVHCPHISFEADEDVKGFVKCNETDGVLWSDLFTEEELGLFYFASNLLGLGNDGIDLKMEACTY